MNVIREIERINEKELQNGIYGGSGKGSWHEKYKDSAWVYVGGLPYELTEGDIICVMSQWGEIEDINLVREKATNKSQGFAFVKYEDQRSTILAVDNFNGIQILQRTIRVDHVNQYKLPKEVREKEEELLEENPDAEVQIGPGHAYKSQELQTEYTVNSGVNLWAKPFASDSSRVISTNVNSESVKMSKKKKSKDGKGRKEHKKKHKKHRRSEENEDEDGPKEHFCKKTRRDDSSQENDTSRVAPLHTVAAKISVQKLPPPPTGGWCLAVQYFSSHILASYLCSRLLWCLDGNAFSWRGRRDPSLIAQAEEERRRQRLQEKRGGEPTRRDEFTGFGGMHRRR